MKCQELDVHDVLDYLNEELRVDATELCTETVAYAIVEAHRICKNFEILIQSEIDRNVSGILGCSPNAAHNRIKKYRVAFFEKYSATKLAHLFKDCWYAVVTCGFQTDMMLKGLAIVIDNHIGGKQLT